MSDSLWCHELQHTMFLCPLLSCRICLNLCPLNQWCYLTISSSVTPSPSVLNLSQHMGHFQWVNILACRTPWTAALQASLSSTISRSLLKIMSIELVMLSNHLILCHSLLLLPLIFPSIRVFPRISSLHQVARVFEFQLQHQSFQWIFRVKFL